MVERQFRGRVLSAAVLAGRMVSQQNILSRERSTFEGNVDVFRQANNRRCVNGESLRVKDMAVVLLYARYSLEDHHHSAPFGAHVDGLKGSI